MTQHSSAEGSGTGVYISVPSRPQLIFPEKRKQKVIYFSLGNAFLSLLLPLSFFLSPQTLQTHTFSRAMALQRLALFISVIAFLACAVFIFFFLLNFHYSLSGRLMTCQYSDIVFIPKWQRRLVSKEGRENETLRHELCLPLYSISTQRVLPLFMGCAGQHHFHLDDMLLHLPSEEP